jgi:hypothetical protein
MILAKLLGLTARHKIMMVDFSGLTRKLDSRQGAMYLYFADNGCQGLRKSAPVRLAIRRRVNRIQLRLSRLQFGKQMHIGCSQLGARHKIQRKLI